MPNLPSKRASRGKSTERQVSKNSLPAGTTDHDNANIQNMHSGGTPGITPEKIEIPSSSSIFLDTNKPMSTSKIWNRDSVVQDFRFILV